MWFKKNTSTALGASHAIFACLFSGKAAADRSYVLLNVSRPLKKALCWMVSFFVGELTWILNSKGIVVYKATKLSNLHTWIFQICKNSFGRFFGWKGANFTHLEDPGMLIMNPSEKLSKYTCFSVLRHVNLSNQLLKTWSHGLRVGALEGSTGNPGP